MIITGDLGSATAETLTNNRNVKEYLKSVLCNAECTKCSNFLIQFWVPTSKVGGRCVLTTSNQPFGLHRIERGLCEYRKHCMGLEFNEEEDESGGGSQIGQVFRHKQKKYTEILGSCTTKGHPLRFFARKCGIKRSLVLPLFKPSGRCCVGVLELLDTSKSSFLLDDPHILAKHIFEVGNSITPSPLKLEIEGSREDSVVTNEINKALQVVCTTHQLPLAQIWIPCCTSTALAYVDNLDKSCYSPYLSSSDKFSSTYQNGDANIYCGMKGFNSFFYKYCTFGKFQGVVGKALSYHKPFFCRDVTQLPIYPLSNVARVSGLTACYAICLHSTRAKNHDYVLEFFLPPNWNTISEDLRPFLELLSTMVKNLLPGFKICSGEEPCVEVGKNSMNDEPDSFIMSQTTSVQPIPESFANERETERNQVVVGETVIENGSNILGVEQNGKVEEKMVEISGRDSGEEVGEEFFVEAAMNDEITTRLPPIPESLKNETKVVQLSDDESTVMKKESNVLVAEQNNVAARRAERKQRTTETSFSFEDIEQHFGKKQEDAAESLDISRSTLKRLCRKHGINRWPFPKRKKVNHSSTSKLKHVNEPLQRGTQGLPKSHRTDPSCSAAHVTTSVTESEDFVAVKAKYRDVVIKFQLSFSSGMAELTEKVTKRLPLKDGTFSIRHEDDEGDLVLIACDEDLLDCLHSWRSLPNKKTIRIFVDEPITNQAP